MKKTLRVSLLVIGLLAVFLFSFAAMCSTTPPELASQNNFRSAEQKVTNAYQKALTAAVPYPLEQMKDSLERRQLREKLLRFNQPSKIGYVTLLTDFGQVVSSYTIMGKVSNTNSMLTTLDHVDCINYTGDGKPEECLLAQSPGDDGSYGPNESGVFFFTTEDVLIVWNGLFLYSDYPQALTVEPLVVYDATEATPSSVGE